VLGSANADLVTSVATAPKPGETVRGTAFATFAGGKGANQAIAAARAGARVTFLGAVGDDAHGRLLLETLAASGVDAAAVDVLADAPTGIANVVVESDGENAIIVVAGANAGMVSLDDRHRAAIRVSDFLLLQFELGSTIVDQAAAFAAAHGVRVILTPAPTRAISEGLRRDTWLLVPNESESIALSGRDDVMAAGHLLAQRFARVVITSGARGSTLFVRDRDPVTVDAVPARAVDTTGAGDTFVGALATALGENQAIVPAMRWASAAAACCVQAHGSSESIPFRAAIETAGTTSARMIT
jgi:ribokinase